MFCSAVLAYENMFEMLILRYDHKSKKYEMMNLDINF